MRLLLIANRLPVSVTIANERVTYAKSVGGLATGLSAVSEHYHTLWIGALNLTREEVDGHVGTIKDRLAQMYNCLPLILSSEEMNGFYNGLSNSLLWPLFHGMPSPAFFPNTWWAHYVQVNKKFSQAILAIVQHDDVLWVNDYHLLLLPQMLRSALGKHRIGFFLHIPYPEPSVLDRLPFRDDLLDGILGSDQVGVYTDKYKQRLVASLNAHLRRKNNNCNLVESNMRPVKVGTFPMGIDPSKIKELLDNPGVRASVNDLQAKFAGKKVILSADRLDYTKGILQKLHSYEVLLERYPKFRKRVQLVLIVAPCRMSIDTYSQLNKDIALLVHCINLRYKTLSWEPIHFINRVVPYEELLAHYKVADVAVITPLEDAMNIMAKEFLVVKGGEAGALVLSRNAGAAIELTRAYLVDPLQQDEIVDAMHKALLADRIDVLQRNATMLRCIERQTVFTWTSDFLNSFCELGRREI